METFILWCGFIGAWLLFAGPVYQAALELRDQDIERERIQAASKKVTVARHVSAWWWLLPPVKYILERRQDRLYRREYFAVLEPEDREALLAFINKAQAWLLVGAGGLLIAMKETYELAEHLEWSLKVYWPIVIGHALVSLLHTIFRLKAEHDIKSAGN